MQIIYKSNDISEAHILKGLLNSHAIETYIGGYYLQGGIGDLSAMDYINIQVHKKDIAEAQAVISKYENTQDQVIRPKSIGKTPVVIKITFSILAAFFVSYLHWVLSGL